MGCCGGCGGEDAVKNEDQQIDENQRETESKESDERSEAQLASIKDIKKPATCAGFFIYGSKEWIVSKSPKVDIAPLGLLRKRCIVNCWRN